MEMNVKSKLTALLEKEQDRKVTFQAFSFFISIISQKYLRNRLSVEVKTKLLAELDITFELLKGFKDRRLADAPINKLINDFETILHLGIKNTADTHYKSLKEQSNRLAKQLKYYLVSNEDFNKVVKDFLLELDKNIFGETETSKALAEVRKELAAIEPITVNSVRDYFNRRLPTLRDVPGNPQVIEVLTKIQNDAKGLQIYFAADEINEADFLSQLDLLHENIDHLINGKDHTQALAGSHVLEMDVDELIQHKDRVIKLAAEIVLKKKIEIRTKPESMSREFFALVKARAISLGATNPEIVDLTHQLNRNTEEIRGLKEAAVRKEEQHKEDLERQRQSAAKILSETIAQLKLEKDTLEQSLKTQLQAVSGEKEKQGTLITGLRSDLQALTTQSKATISQLEQQLVAKEKAYLAELASQKETAAKTLRETSAQLKLEKDTLEQSLKTQLQAVSGEKEKQGTLITGLRSDLQALTIQSKATISQLEQQLVAKEKEYLAELASQKETAAKTLRETSAQLKLEKDTLEQSLKTQLQAVSGEKEKQGMLITGLRSDLQALTTQSKATISQLEQQLVVKEKEYLAELASQKETAAKTLKETSAQLKLEKDTLEQSLKTQLQAVSGEKEKQSTLITGLRSDLQALTTQSKATISQLEQQLVAKEKAYLAELASQKEPSSRPAGEVSK